MTNLSILLFTNVFYVSLSYFSNAKKTNVLKQVGDRVVALPEFRAWAELCAVPTKYVYKIPEELSFQDAAAMAMNFMVAYIIVYDLLSLRAGKSVVLHSAGGGVVSLFLLTLSDLYLSSMSFLDFRAKDYVRNILTQLFFSCTNDRFPFKVKDKNFTLQLEQ